MSTQKAAIAAMLISHAQAKMRSLVVRGGREIPAL